MRTNLQTKEYTIPEWLRETVRDLRNLTVNATPEEMEDLRKARAILAHMVIVAKDMPPEIRNKAIELLSDETTDCEYRMIRIWYPARRIFADSEFGDLL